MEIKPRIITVLRSGTRPRKAVRVLLNNRNTKSLDMVLADLTNTVRLDSGAVRKIYTLGRCCTVELAAVPSAGLFVISLVTVSRLFPTHPACRTAAAPPAARCRTM